VVREEGKEAEKVRGRRGGMGRGGEKRRSRKVKVGKRRKGRGRG